MLAAAELRSPSFPLEGEMLKIVFKIIGFSFSGAQIQLNMKTF